MLDLAITFVRSEVQPSRRCMSHSMHPQCCNEVFHLVGTFSGNPSLAVSRIQWVLSDFFTGESYSFFGRVFHHRNIQKCNETSNVQFKVAIFAMRHGRAYLIEVGIFLAGCTWEEHEHHTTLMSKICQLNLPETNSLPLDMKGWKMRSIEISFWGPAYVQRLCQFQRMKNFKTFQFDHLISVFHIFQTDFPFES